MANIKTAISIEKPLFEQVDALAHELKIPRSRLFVIAAREFIKRHKNQKLLDAINDAYDDLPSSEEETTLQQMRFRHFELVKNQW
ncbi:MAG: CopG family transcriptional regulator [Deltaproteobacteria bacterium]|nr:CopG family transcriptional regulator [Deltaproteobacteria bacterium]MBW1908113.1 CopG family transcriptional regulator [Deltaproteobacteria bacterium]MBW2033983.1 CopG family transcriptional regulator [Deltaproteobacteria bacterium]MBW2114781.1 CopG family transcriptional regulator [Deltaproteobacteria bacterium]MBW2169373.1 CopG family transcriptional regulator [Deltaproteobacteria bacterium]